MQRFHVFLPDPILTALRQHAAALGVSVAELLRRAIEAHYAHLLPSPHATPPPRRRRRQEPRHGPV